MGVAFADQRPALCNYWRPVPAKEQTNADQHENLIPESENNANSVDSAEWSLQYRIKYNGVDVIEVNAARVDILRNAFKIMF